MPPSKDHYLSAYLLVKKYDAGAEEYATKMIWEFRHLRDEKGVAAWLLILEAVKEVRNMTPPGEVN